MVVNVGAPTPWRVIALQSYDASMNMAIDHAISEEVLKGNSPPTIRFYMWENGAVSFGYDKFEKIINKAACKYDGVGVVRRPSAGNTVYHSPKDLTYSVICPKYMLGEDLSSTTNLDINRTAYKTICSWIIDALESLGIQSEFYGKNDIVQPKTLKKLVGNAQRIKSEKVILQHGAIFNYANPDEWSLYIDVPKSQLEGITSLEKLGVENTQDVYEALLAAFTKNDKVHDFYFDDLTKEELELAKNLAKTTYKSIHLRDGTACVIDHFKQ